VTVQAAKHTGSLASTTAMATAVAIFCCGKLGRLHVWMGNRFIQYFGMISYSLYLTHWDIGGRVVKSATNSLGIRGVSRLHGGFARWERAFLRLTSSIVGRTARPTSEPVAQARCTKSSPLSPIGDWALPWIMAD